MSLHLSFSSAAQVRGDGGKLGAEEFEMRLSYNLESSGSVSQVVKRVILGLSWVDYRGQERGL